MALGQIQDGVHIRRLAVKVDRDDSDNRHAYPLIYQPPRAAVHATLDLEVFPKLFRIHVVGALVDVHKIGTCTRLGDRFRRGDKGVRNGHDDVTLLDTSGDQSKAQSVRAAAHAETVLSVAEPGERFFKILDHGPANKASRIQGTLENSH